MPTVKDIRTPSPAAAIIVATIHAGRLEQARGLVRSALDAGADPETLLLELGAAVEPEPDAITLGAGPLVSGNPTRDGWAWRCGPCLHAFRNGGRLPAAGVNYKTQRGASNAAHKHSDEDHDGSVPVKEITQNAG